MNKGGQEKRERTIRWLRGTGRMLRERQGREVGWCVYMWKCWRMCAHYLHRKRLLFWLCMNLFTFFSPLWMFVLIVYLRRVYFFFPRLLSSNIPSFFFFSFHLPFFHLSASHISLLQVYCTINLVRVPTKVCDCLLILFSPPPFPLCLPSLFLPTAFLHLFFPPSSLDSCTPL